MANPPIHPYEAVPRVAPISTDQLRPEWKATLARIPGAGLKGSGFPGYVLGELMRSPEIFGPFLEWWVTAKSATALSKREQELVILRMGRLYSSDYVWKHHLLTAREFGAKPEEIAALFEGRFDDFPPPGNGPSSPSQRPWSVTAMFPPRSGRPTVANSARRKWWI